MSAAIAIFVKTPGHSPIKTRLARTIGAAEAEDWYQRALAAVVEAVDTTTRARAGFSAYFAVAESAALDADIWQGLPRVAQGEGDLGSRMAKVHADLVAAHGAAILIGADLPQLDPADLLKACAWLADPAPRQVLGPAFDGGFWLYGSNRPIAQGHWRAVEYSSASTAQRFIAEFDGFGAWLSLPQRQDLDQISDWARCLRELRALPAPGPAQRGLARSMAARVLLRVAAARQ